MERRRFLAAGVVAVLVLASADSPAQPAPGAPPLFGCGDCAAAGQQASLAAVEPTQIEFIPAIRPAFRGDQGLRLEITARVLSASPLLMLEQLDTRILIVGRDLKPVRTVPSAGRATSCDILPVASVDAASRALVASLRFNDLIAGAIVLHDERSPDSMFGNQVFTAVRRVTGPLPASDRERCSNRSGRLVEYRGPAGDLVTVFNDGGIHYRDPQLKYFTSQRLTPSELAALLKEFAAVRFDDLAAVFPRPNWSEPPAVTLMAARYQRVPLAGNERALAPIVRAMIGLAGRAMSGVSYRLTFTGRQALDLQPWPYPQVPLAGFAEAKDQARGEQQSRGTVSGRRALLYERLPDEFIVRLPTASFTSTSGIEPGSRYFTVGDRLYRVAHNPNCDPSGPECRTFLSLIVSEVLTIEAALIEQGSALRLPPDYPVRGTGTPGRQSSGLTVLLEAGLGLFSPGPYLWSDATGIRLRDLPAGGTRIGSDEYERHKPVLFGSGFSRQRTLESSSSRMASCTRASACVSSSRARLPAEGRTTRDRILSWAAVGFACAIIKGPLRADSAGVARPFRVAARA
jgi:hypothetical protein